MAGDEAIEMYNEIIRIGCCKRCALRYLGESKDFITFEDPLTSLINFGVVPIMEQFKAELCRKKIKCNPCTSCLGLLEDLFLDEMLDCKSLARVLEYDSQTFAALITFPSSVLLRDHSIKLHLKKKFPSFDMEKVIKVNQAWRYSVENKLGQILSKKYKSASGLCLHFFTAYRLEHEEMQPIQAKFTGKTISKHNLINLLDLISDGDFEKLLRVPSPVPFYHLELKDLKYCAASVFLMGTYWKYSRKLPFKNADSNSVESVILEAVKTVARDFESAAFQASSFDGEDVRVLGKGRLFYIQLDDPKFDVLSHEKCRQMENLIRKRGDIEVKNLKPLEKKDVLELFSSETQSSRLFKLLCLVYACKNVNYCVNAVNMYKTLMVQQMTPIRLLHKRPHQKKTRKIFYMKATKIKDNLIELDVCLESGVHIEEFVTGDWGRTEPSLGSIMKAKVDVLAIDVLEFGSVIPCALEEEDVII